MILSLFACIGCDQLFKGPRNSYRFSLTIQNESDYNITMIIRFSERAASDECSRSSGTNFEEVAPGEMKSVSISIVCYQKPSSSANAVFPEEADIEERYYLFSADRKVICTNLGCEIEG